MIVRQLRNLPLDFLPTFEAAGRLRSFKAAASELHLTPAAVSQQMRLLQEALGVALFVRSGRSVALTYDGERYLREVRRTLAELAEASSPSRVASGEARVLRLSTAPLIAHELLLPRMRSLRAQLPGWELRIEATMRLVDFERDPVDAAVRVGGGPWTGLTTRPIGALSAAAVCTPRVARRIQRVADLTRETLIEVRGQEHRSFEPLLSRHGVAFTLPERWRFETCLEAVRAAEQGLGVTLALFPMLTSWVSAGRLAVPLAHREPLPGALSLVHRTEDAERFPFDALTDWLQAQFQALPALDPGRIARAG